MALGVAILASIGSYNRIRGLEVSARGIAWQAARKPWTVAWDDLTRVHLVITYRRRTFRQRRASVVRLGLDVLRPNPTMAHLQRTLQGATPGRYVVWLGPRRDLLEPLDDALRAFAGARYQGVTDDKGKLRWD